MTRAPPSVGKEEARAVKPIGRNIAPDRCRVTDRFVSNRAGSADHSGKEKIASIAAINRQ